MGWSWDIQSTNSLRGSHGPFSGDFPIVVLVYQRVMGLHRIWSCSEVSICSSYGDHQIHCGDGCSWNHSRWDMIGMNNEEVWDTNQSSWTTLLFGSAINDCSCNFIPDDGIECMSYIAGLMQYVRCGWNRSRRSQVTINWSWVTFLRPLGGEGDDVTGTWKSLPLLSSTRSKKI